MIKPGSLYKNIHINNKVIASNLEEQQTACPSCGQELKTNVLLASSRAILYCPACRICIPMDQINVV